MHGFLHDHIADMGEEEAGYALLLTILEDSVAAAAVDARHEDGVKTPESVADVGKFAVEHQLLGDIVEALAGLSLDGAESVPVEPVAVDQDGLPAGINAEIEAGRTVGPDQVQEALDCQHREEEDRTPPAVPANGDEQVEDYN